MSPADPLSGWPTVAVLAVLGLLTVALLALVAREDGWAALLAMGAGAVVLAMRAATR